MNPVENKKIEYRKSRLLDTEIDLTKIDYDTDVLIIGGGALAQ